MARGNGCIGLPEAIAGNIPGSGGTQRLARLLGPGRAVQLILTGAMFNADEAAAIGLVTRAVDAPQLLAETMALAEQLAGQPSLSVQGVKRAVHDGVGLSLADGIALEARHFITALVSRDAAALGRRYLEQLETATAESGMPAEAGEIATEIFDEFRKGDAVALRGS